MHAGARPVFADIEPVTFNLDPEKLAAAAQRHPKARAVIPVHLFGACADMDAIRDVAGRHNLAVIEDAAQAIGAEYKGKRAGSLGDIACFSFFPTKNLGAFGDGGALTTNDDGLAERLRMLRLHGSRQQYIYDEVGYNSRLDALQAAVLAVKLKHLDSWTELRQRNVRRYANAFADANVPVTTPAALEYQTRHVWHHYNIRAERRDELKSHLAGQGIGAAIYYPVPLHLQKCFEGLGYRPGDFPESEKLASEILALPVHSELEDGDIEAVVAAVRSFYRS